MITVQSLLALIDVNNELDATAAAIELTSVSGLDEAKQGELSFLASAKYRSSLKTTLASVVILSEKDVEHCPDHVTKLVVDDPYLAYAKVSHLFNKRPKATGAIHPTAVVAEDVTLGQNVTIGANAVVERGAKLGDGVEIGALSFVGEYCEIGPYTRTEPRVTIEHRTVVGASCVFHGGSVIGSSGFGYAPTSTGWQAIAQIGRVVIGDRVEIGANTTIDRGAIGDTVIESDVIIDNLVQLGHNVRIGRRTAMASQVGISGSTQVGEGCTIGGQAGFTGHIKIADNSHFTGQAMVTKGTTEPGLYSSGMPAQKSRDWRKLVARLKQLESFNDRLKKLEQDPKDT